MDYYNIEGSRALRKGDKISKHFNSSKYRSCTAEREFSQGL
jgi:hypothetical protein